MFLTNFSIFCSFTFAFALTPGFKKFRLNLDVGEAFCDIEKFCALALLNRAGVVELSEELFLDRNLPRHEVGCRLWRKTIFFWTSLVLAVSELSSFAEIEPL